MVAPTEAGAEVLGVSIQGFVANFYADDGLVALTQTERLQRAFDSLAYLFNWVGLWNNMPKMASMK